MTIQEELKRQAVELGLCKQWQDEWGEPNIAQLCDKYIRGLDFCIKHNYPSIDYLDKHFKGKVEKYGIYINEEAESVNQPDVVCNGNSNVRIKTNGVCDIYVRHNSEIHITTIGKAFVYVTMLDDSKLFIDSKDEMSRICVSQFGGTIETPNLVDKVYKKDFQSFFIRNNQ